MGLSCLSIIPSLLSILMAGALVADPVAISSMVLGKVKQGYGSPQLDLSVDKHPLTTNGKVYPHGFGTHADSYLAIKPAEGSTRLTALAGIDDETGNALARGGTFVSGSKLYSSPALVSQSETSFANQKLTEDNRRKELCRESSTADNFDDLDVNRLLWRHHVQTGVFPRFRK